eukprot:COSAG02_NODE_27039_length_618_cov_1.080925_1_plen_53_part_00
MQLLIINLAALENVTVALPERAGERTSNAQSQATSSYAAVLRALWAEIRVRG